MATSHWLVCDLTRLELTVSRGQFVHLYRSVYRKVSKHASKQACRQVSGSNQVHRLMVVGNHQCNAANLNQRKAQFQLELSLAQISPSLVTQISKLRGIQKIFPTMFDFGMLSVMSNSKLFYTSQGAPCMWVWGLSIR